MSSNSHAQRTDELHQHDINDAAGDMWSSSSKGKSKTLDTSSTRSGVGATSTQSYRGYAKYAEEARQGTLRQELGSVRRVNEAIEGLIGSLETAKRSMETVNQTVYSASTLLNTWTRILSQTEHNQRLVLNPTWQGSSQDMADIEHEAHAKQQAVERREMEEQARKVAAARKAEDVERTKAGATAKVPKATGRGRGNPAGRASTTSYATPTSYVSVGGQGGVKGTLRGSSTSGRRTVTGVGPRRGKGRGS